jgi:hypothetical protein
MLRRPRERRDGGHRNVFAMAGRPAFDPWRDRLESLVAGPPADPGGAVVVLCAHPCDPVLSVGGWLGRQTDREVTFVHTCEEARDHDAMLGGLDELGISDVRVSALSVTDLHRTDDLAAAVADATSTAALVLAPFADDGHPEHEALGRAAVSACQDGTPLWQLPLWAWAAARPDGQPWLGSLRRLDGESAARHRKRAALRLLCSGGGALCGDDSGSAHLDQVVMRHALFAPEAVVV